jgi:hypothetical protein
MGTAWTPLQGRWRYFCARAQRFLTQALTDTDWRSAGNQKKSKTGTAQITFIRSPNMK